MRTFLAIVLTSILMSECYSFGLFDNSLIRTQTNTSRNTLSINTTNRFANNSIYNVNQRLSTSFNQSQSSFNNVTTIGGNSLNGTQKIWIFGNSSTVTNSTGDKNYTLTTKCFRDLGCITSDGFFDTLKTIPLIFTDPREMNVTFNLFTRNNKKRSQIYYYNSSDQEIRESLFNPNRNTKFIIHGYMSGYNEDNWMANIKNYLLNQSDSNVFAIDWSKGSNSINYFQSAADTRVVGAMVAYFINKLINVTTISPKRMHCIGHSLGAHTCGFAGQRLRTKMSHISGLDPAGPAFLLNDTDTRLDETDADLVLVLHTNAGVFTSEGSVPVEVTGMLGNTHNLGHYDFWPNGGSKQLGCGVIETIVNSPSLKNITAIPTCNHGRAHTFPVSNRNQCQFIGYQCNSYAEFDEGKCADCGTDNSNCKPMEFQFDYWDKTYKTERLRPQQHMNLYLKTNHSEPFCLFHYQVLVQISSNSTNKAGGELDIEIGNNTKVTIARSWTGSQSGQDLGFKAGHNYTQLYINSKEVELTPIVNVKWTSLLRSTLKIDRIVVNFMSHISRSVRQNKSKKYCPSNNTMMSNDQSMTFQTC